MAWVGQIDKHAVQTPQCAVVVSSTGNGKLIKSSPKKNHEPALRLIKLECLPIQPNPAFSAKAFSRTGALSTKPLMSTLILAFEKVSETSDWILSARFCKRLRIIL